VAFISQSGRLAQDYAEYAQHRGLKFSKSISFGNAYGLDESDFLEYLGNDPESKVIGIYLEGVSNGERFMEVVRDVNRLKPIVLWKGGLTEAGAKAARSHTGSMSGQERIWDAFFRQTGALKATCLEDIADFHLAFLNLPPIRGKRVAHLDVGGGSSVASADFYARAGLEVPTLSEKTLRELRQFIPSAGTSIMNPLDIAGVMRDTSLLERTLDLVASDPLVDIIVITQHWLMIWFTRGKVIHPMAEYLTEFVKQNRYGKPVVAVTRCWTEAEEGRGWLMEMDKALLDAGIPTYPTEERAIKSLSRLMKYHSFLAESTIA
jgi:acyl-CoA synthetase (NDP forming)